MKKLEGTILPPQKHTNVPAESKWLSGQGEGTWFCITKEEVLKENQYRIKRISPQGNIDCDRVFELDKDSLHFDFNNDWQMTYISHCLQVKVIQNGIVFVFNYLNEF